MPGAAQGRVNGLDRRRAPVRRSVRLSRAKPLSMIAAGAGLYLVALVFPVFLGQVNQEIFALAVAGTVLLLFGLHVRWTRNPDAA